MSDLMNQVENEPDDLLGEEMLKKLVLNKEPFSGEPDSPFHIEAWHTQNHLLQHLILYNNVLMVMTGKPGTGKTTYANQFADSLSGQFLAHKITATDTLSAKSLQLRLIQLFSLNSVGMDMNDIVGGYLRQLKERKQHCVLIIDDAHLLSDDILQMLYYYISRQSETAYLHFILVGDTELVAYIEDQLGESHESVHFFDLPTMTMAETSRYLTERLEDAGFQGTLPFDNNTLLAIHKEAEGDFRRLLILATRELIALYKSKRLKKSFFWRRYVATGVVSSLVIVISFALTPLLMKHQLKTNNLVLPERDTLVDFALDASEEREVTIKSFRKSVEPKAHQEMKKKHIVLAPKPTPKPVPTAPPPQKKTPTPPKKLVTKTKPSSPKRQVESIPEPSMETQLRAIKADRMARAMTDNVVLDSVVELPEPKPRVKKVTTPPKKVSKTVSKPSLQTPKNHYVIQLLASTKIEAIRTFIDKHPLSKDIQLYKTHVKDRDWFTLVMGDYLSAKKAKKALASLPKDIKKFSPWVRTTKGLSPIKDLL